MFPAISLLAVPTLLFAAPEPELTFQQVLKANTAAIQAIRSLQVTIDVSNNFEVPGEEKVPVEPVPTLRIEWWRDEGHERVRQDYVRGRGPRNYDAYNGPRGYKRLNNYDPNFKPPLSEAISGPASGEIGKTRTDVALSGQARAMSFMRNLPGAETLEEYVAKYPNPMNKLVATPATSKLGCYEIALVQEKPASAGSNYDVCDLRIFVDPKVGFWIRRIERGPWQKTNDKDKKGTNIVEVQEFKNCGNGIFWPLRGYIKSRLPGDTIGPDVLIRHTLHSINQPLTEEEFEIHFPDWLRVRDRSTGQVIIWHPEDKQSMKFASEAEYNEWYRPRMKDPYQEMNRIPKQVRLVWLVGISSVVGLLLLFLILWRRKSLRAVEGLSQSGEKTQDDASVLP